MQKRVTVFRLRRHTGLWAVVLCLALLFALRGAVIWGRVLPALSPSLFGVSLVIDAGHGGADPGMVGGAVLEKDVNLAVARCLSSYCRSAGAGVTVTREGDAALNGSKRADLEARAALAETARADLFVSLHCNSFVADPSQHGAQVFYEAGNEEGRRLAEALQRSLREQLGNTERAALPHPDSYLLKNIDCPAVIVEMGFLSNAAEEEQLASPGYQWELGWALFRGVSDYLLAAE